MNQRQPKKKMDNIHQDFQLLLNKITISILYMEFFKMCIQIMVLTEWRCCKDEVIGGGGITQLRSLYPHLSSLLRTTCCSKVTCSQ